MQRTCSSTGRIIQLNTVRGLENTSASGRDSGAQTGRTCPGIAEHTIEACKRDAQRFARRPRRLGLRNCTGAHGGGRPLFPALQLLRNGIGLHVWATDGDRGFADGGMRGIVGGLFVAAAPLPPPPPPTWSMLSASIPPSPVRNRHVCTVPEAHLFALMGPDAQRGARRSCALTSGNCLADKTTFPQGVGGWVCWPQILAFWATRHPRGEEMRFFWILGLRGALRLEVRNKGL